MLTSRRPPALAMAVALLFVACHKEVEPVAVDIAEFEVHECNRATAAHELMTGRNASDYVGLNCVAWRFGSRNTVIDVINQLAGCGWGGRNQAERSLWTPAAAKLGFETLRLSVEWDFASVSACGACVHDFSLELDKLVGRGPLDLELSVRDCTECEWVEDSMRLPLGEVDAGIACRYLPWHELAPAEHEKGKLHTPPRDGACDAPLVASDDDEPLCLAPCEADADCPLRDLLSCDAGLCRLSEPWRSM